MRTAIVVFLGPGLLFPGACSSSSASPVPDDAGSIADAGPADGADGGGDAGDAAPSCGQPATTTFACDAMPAGEGACQGGPSIGGSGGDAGAGSSYPLGCVATLPKCDALYGNTPVTCSCTPLGMTAMWACGE
jgi:hypothetical protein